MLGWRVPLHFFHPNVGLLNFDRGYLLTDCLRMGSMEETGEDSKQERSEGSLSLTLSLLDYKDKMQDTTRGVWFEHHS